MPGNANFRPDPERAIVIVGTIDASLLERLILEAMRLHSQSGEPITVYINSHGGSTLVAEQILELLRSPSQDRLTPCRLITVAVSYASSAAADLLSAGDYALAHAGSRLMYHGSSRADGRPLTKELAASLADGLDKYNNFYALRLARSCIDRILFRSRLLSEAIRKTSGSAEEAQPEVERFMDAISQRVSAGSRETINEARDSYARIQRLSVAAQPHLQGTDSLPEQKQILQAIVDHESDRSSIDPRAGRMAVIIGRVHEDVLVLEDLMYADHGHRVHQLASRWESTFLNTEDGEDLARIPLEAQAQAKHELCCQRIAPYWFFCVSLCRALQRGDHEFSAADAYWLGLIDEVIGQPELVSFRTLHEQQEKQE